jgi:hypothetical protein
MAKSRKRALQPPVSDVRKMAIRRYSREYMRWWREVDPTLRSQRRLLAEEACAVVKLHKRVTVIKPCRAGKSICESAGRAHHHCECGLPIGLDRVVCPLCIAEQPNVERVMAGRLWVGIELHEVA